MVRPRAGNAVPRVVPPQPRDGAAGRVAHAPAAVGGRAVACRVDAQCESEGGGRRSGKDGDGER